MAIAAGLKVFRQLLKKFGPKRAAKEMKSSGLFSRDEIRAIIAKNNKAAAKLRRGGKRGTPMAQDRLTRLRQRVAKRDPAVKKYYEPKSQELKDYYKYKAAARTGKSKPPVKKPGVRTRLGEKARQFKAGQARYAGAEKDALTTLNMRNNKMKAEVTKALRGYTPGRVAQTPFLREQKAKLIRMLQKMGFMNPRAQAGRGMSTQRHWDEVDEVAQLNKYREFNRTRKKL